MSQMYREYFFQVAEALLACNRTFCEAHPEIEMIDLVFVSEIKTREKTAPVTLTIIKSTDGQMNKDILDTQRAVELCEMYVQAQKK